MNLDPRSRPGTNPQAFEPLFTALRREESDARVWQLMQKLHASGVSTDDVVARVVKSVGAAAGVRAQKLARNRAQLMATGTMQRYKPSRARRFRRWLANLKESLSGGPPPRSRR